MIDFHCHIMTPGSQLPLPDSGYYETLEPLTKSGPWMDLVWQETVEAVAENLRSAPALRSFRQMSPLIYSEMVRRMKQTTAHRLTVEMARRGVTQACVVAIDPVIPTDEIIAACAPTKGILLPFGSVDPWADNWRELLLQTLQKPIAGFKFHSNLQNLSFGEPRMYEILSVLQEQAFRRPIFVHTGDYPIYKPIKGDWTVEIGPLLAEFPELNFVCGHCGWNRPAAAFRAARKHKNLTLETSWQPPQILRRLCDLLGPERLVLGSDFPLFSMRRAIRNCKIVMTAGEFQIISEDVPKRLLAQF